MVYIDIHEFCISSDTSTEVQVLQKKVDEYVTQVEILQKEFKEVKAELEGSKNTMDSVCDLISKVLVTIPSSK